MSFRKVILYISMSLDGYLAGPDDDLSFLDPMQQEGQDYGYADFSAQTDTLILGRKTYDKVIQLVGYFPQAETHSCYVISRQERPNERGVTFYNGSLKALIHQLRQQPGKHIHCDGGGEIVRLLMQEDVIDEYIISVIPTILGDGKRLFMGGTPPLSLKHIRTDTYETGLVQVRYGRIRN